MDPPPTPHIVHLEVDSKYCTCVPRRPSRRKLPALPRTAPAAPAVPASRLTPHAVHRTFRAVHRSSSSLELLVLAAFAREELLDFAQRQGLVLEQAVGLGRAKEPRAAVRTARAAAAVMAAGAVRAVTVGRAATLKPSGAKTMALG